MLIAERDAALCDEGKPGEPFRKVIKQGRRFALAGTAIKKKVPFVANRFDNLVSASLKIRKALPSKLFDPARHRDFKTLLKWTTLIFHFPLKNLAACMAVLMVRFKF